MFRHLKGTKVRLGVHRACMKPNRLARPQEIDGVSTRSQSDDTSIVAIYVDIFLQYAIFKWLNFI